MGKPRFTEEFKVDAIKLDLSRINSASCFRLGRFLKEQNIFEEVKVFKRAIPVYRVFDDWNDEYL